VNFLMLVATAPTPTLTATVSGGNIHISFPTQTGYSYQLQYKNNLTDAIWNTSGAPSLAMVRFRPPMMQRLANSRFYRVQIQ